jgi:two-component system nitrogen regulation response regulator NtrX
MANDILIVDDEADIRDLVAGILDDEGFSTRTARDSDSALAEIANRRPHLVFLDIWLQGSKLDGLQLLEQIKRDHAEVPVVMISGHGNIETAVAAIKRGAYDFIEKPFKADRLIQRVDRPLGLHEPVTPDHRPRRQGQQPHPDRRPVRRRQGARRAHAA